MCLHAGRAKPDIAADFQMPNFSWDKEQKNVEYPAQALEDPSKEHARSSLPLLCSGIPTMETCIASKVLTLWKHSQEIQPVGHASGSHSFCTNLSLFEPRPYRTRLKTQSPNTCENKTHMLSAAIRSAASLAFLSSNFSLFMASIPVLTRFLSCAACLLC